jgi:hypothetical protein
MFNWIMSLFRKNKIDMDEKDDEPSTIIKTPDNDYDDIISKLSLDEIFTPKDIKYMRTLSNTQLVHLVLLKQ